MLDFSGFAPSDGALHVNSGALPPVHYRGRESLRNIRLLGGVWAQMSSPQAGVRLLGWSGSPPPRNGRARPSSGAGRRDGAGRLRKRTLAQHAIIRAPRGEPDPSSCSPLGVGRPITRHFRVSRGKPKPSSLPGQAEEEQGPANKGCRPLGGRRLLKHRPVAAPLPFVAQKNLAVTAFSLSDQRHREAPRPAVPRLHAASRPSASCLAHPTTAPRRPCLALRLAPSRGALSRIAAFASCPSAPLFCCAPICDIPLRPPFPIASSLNPPALAFAPTPPPCAARFHAGPFAACFRTDRSCRFHPCCARPQSTSCDRPRHPLARPFSF